MQSNSCGATCAANSSPVSSSAGNIPLLGYIVDFVCIPARLVLELDGGQHLDAMDHDAKRTRAIEAQGYRVLRFWNDDVLLRTEAVLEEVLRHLPCGGEGG